MALYRIQFRASVEKQVAALDKPVRRRIAAAIDSLADDPRPPGVITMQGARGLLRIRVGDYRIIYMVQDQKLVILVVDVGHRSTIYRNF